ncbi:hypothetical protein GALL_75810 [mine drainage metagenome]|uniref:Uncharacterized protein n=1 Tax=mine drainage metagenome TaxID=410659 RepID=A0A1J5SQN4_9ZZZZ
MDKKTIYIKTDKGEHEASNLSSDLKRILSLIDNKSRADELAKRAPPSLRESWDEILGELLAGGYIIDKERPNIEPRIAKPKFNPLKMFSPKPAGMFVPKPAAQPPGGDLDFSAMPSARTPDADAIAARQKADVAEKARADLEAKQKSQAAAAELEASVAAAKAKANAEAAAKAQAKAKLEAENAARAKAEAEAKAKQEALVRAQAEAKAKQEAAQRLEAMREAARAKAAQEAAARAKAEAEARVRAEIEAAARAQQEREEKIKREAAIARLKAEEEAARVKAELDAAAKAKAEAEAARLKAEAEAARAKAELEAAKARELAEAKALAEARLKQEAEEKARREAEAARLKAEEKARREAEEARLKAEQEAARVKAELEAAKARAEAEAKALAEARMKQEAEEKARRAAEAARLKAEEEAARIKAEKEAIAKARAEAEAKAAAELLARKQEAEAAAKREAEQNAKLAAVSAERDVSAQKPEEASIAAPAFEIKLDDFLSRTEPVNQVVKPVAHRETPASGENEVEAEQRGTAEAAEPAEKRSVKNAAEEMARLKEEAEAARRKAEEDARRQAEEQALAEEQAKVWAEAEQRAKAQAALELEQSVQQIALSQAKAAKATVSRRPGKPLPWGRIVLGLVAMALIAIIVLPYVYPLTDYIVPLEQRLSAQLKQPVHIGGLSASSLPPRLQLQNVTVGASQEVKAGTVELDFDLLSLPSEIKVISNANLNDVSIDGRMLDKLAASFKLMGSDASYPVRHVTLQRVKIVSDDVALPVFGGIAEIDTRGTLNRVSLHSTDDKVDVDLQSDQGRWQVGVSLKESSLPVLPDIVFSDLSAKGDLGDGEVNFTEMDAHIFNGILLGNGKLSWNKGWRLQGTLDAKTFDLDKMFPKFHIEGEMYGDATFSMSGAKIPQMDDDPQLDGSFTVKKGTLNVDIVETARLLSRDNLVGGRTHFDDMIGQVQLEKHVVHVRQLKIISGMLNANGSFDVSPGNQLSGVLNAEIKLRSGNNPLTLYGNLAEQKLRAGR